MKMARTLILVLVLGLIPCPAIAQQPAGALVLKISGVVWLKHDGKQTRLNPKSDIARALYFGDSVHCEKGGRLTLNTGGATKDLDEQSNWFTIKRKVAAQPDPHEKALVAYGRPGGRDKGFVSKSRVYSPADDDAVVPEFFVIRWTPLKRRCAASFAIQTPTGQELWRQDKVNGALGSLESSTARQALNDYRAQGSEGKLRFNLKDSCGHDDQLTFTLVSVAEEKSLNEDLASWDQEPDKLFAHIGRATVYFRYKMLQQTAEEYEAALALAPSSHDLLKRTSDANWATGNRARAKQLEKRFHQG